MSSFHGHIEQAKRNLDFLEKVNSEFEDVYNWHVTVCFYSALHLVKAHAFKALGTYHRTHNDLANVISPESRIKTPAQVSEHVFVAYKSLFILSRRSRYLYNVKSDTHLSFTYFKHLAKAERHLNTVMEWVGEKYKLKLPVLIFSCIGLKMGELKHFTVS